MRQHHIKKYIKFDCYYYFYFNESIFLQLISAFTSVRSVNKTDAMTLLSTFGSLEEVVKTPVGALALCPGFGMQKAQRLHKTLHEKFLREGKKPK